MLILNGSDDPILGAVTNIWTFTVGPIKSGNTLFIEAEDFNYSNDGIAGGLYPRFADTNCSLVGKDAILGVDSFEVNDGNDSNAIPAYRTPTGVEAAKPDTNGLIRGDRTVNCNYIVGWNDVGDWYNYTRDFGPPARYNVYARLSSGSNAENAELARINGGTTTTNQTKEVLGTFSSPPTGNWDIYHYVPLRDTAGNLVSVLLSGLNTFRFTVLPGSLDFDYLALVKADPPILLLRRDGLNAILE